MNVKIYIHPEYKDTLWVNLSLKAMTAEIMRKRYTLETVEADSIEDIDFDRVFQGEEKRLLIYAGIFNALRPEELACLAKNRVHVILLNYESSVLTGQCSKILLNYRDGMRKIIGYLTACDRTRIALYGINPDSPTDRIKDDYFAEYLRERGGNPARDIYYNYGSLTGCYSRFSEICGEYNAVICANDVVALSLIHRMKERGLRVPEDLYVISFGSSVLTSLSEPTVTSVAVDHGELGRQAVLAYAYLYKNPCDITLNVKVDAELTVRASTAHTPDAGDHALPPLATPMPRVDFYDDPAAHRFFRAERLMLGCDELDYGILAGILAGKTYPVIAEQLYTSENVISYRIKRMCRSTGCQKKSDLVALLSPYLR